MEDVVIRPSILQITNATEIFIFNQTVDEPSRCPITLEDFTDNDVITRIKHCRHTFSTAAINNWFNNHVRCPVCRYDIRDFTPPSDISNNNPPSDISNNNDDAMDIEPENGSIESTMQDLTTEITNIMANYFTENIGSTLRDLSNNTIYHFDIPIVTTTTSYMEDDIQDDASVE